MAAKRQDNGLAELRGMMLEMVKQNLALNQQNIGRWLGLSDLLRW